MQTVFTEPFKPRRRDPCFCHSGDAFKDCCGNLSPDRKTPHGIIIKENTWTRQQCQDLRDIADRCHSEWLKVGRIDDETGETVFSHDENRVTQGVMLGKCQSLVTCHVNNLWRDVIEPELGVEIEWFEMPQLLRYSGGGFYAPHADADTYIRERDSWERSLDRDLSLLIYINEDYEGGNINFTNFEYAHKPKAGELIVFPSDQRYLHCAEKVSSGTRYAIVSWAAVKGSPRVRERAPDGAIAPRAVSDEEYQDILRRTRWPDWWFKLVMWLKNR